MTERPIFFASEYVRVIGDDLKTQTRRVLNPQPVERKNGWFEWGRNMDAPKLTSPKSVTPARLRPTGRAALSLRRCRSRVVSRLRLPPVTPARTQLGPGLKLPIDKLPNKCYY